jgi:hypothetical protein
MKIEVTYKHHYALGTQRVVFDSMEEANATMIRDAEKKGFSFHRYESLADYLGSFGFDNEDDLIACIPGIVDGDAYKLLKAENRPVIEIGENCQARYAEADDTEIDAAWDWIRSDLQSLTAEEVPEPTPEPVFITLNRDRSYYGSDMGKEEAKEINELLQKAADLAKVNVQWDGDEYDDRCIDWFAHWCAGNELTAEQWAEWLKAKARAL